MKPYKKRKYYYFFNSLFTRNYQIESSEEVIDIVIPVIEKDLRILPYCIEGIRRCVTNTIGNIYIVAPSQIAIQDFCKQNSLTFVSENTVLGFQPKDIHYVVEGTNRSGWIFQQLLKWAGTISQTEQYLVIDADHILIRPHTFLTKDGHTVFYRSKEYHFPYYQTMKKLLGKSPVEFLSYVDHKMLFSKQKLQKLKTDIENHCQMKWIQAILANLDDNEISCFSEYEIYGCFFPKEEKILLPWRNKNLTIDKLSSYDELARRYSKRYLSITFPDYKSPKL